MIDLGTGNNNKINWAMNDKQEFVDIVETVRWRRLAEGAALRGSSLHWAGKHCLCCSWQMHGLPALRSPAAALPMHLAHRRVLHAAARPPAWLPCPPTHPRCCPCPPALQVFRGARKGRGLVVSPKDYSTKYRY